MVPPVPTAIAIMSNLPGEKKFEYQWIPCAPDIFHGYVNPAFSSQKKKIVKAWYFTFCLEDDLLCGGVKVSHWVPRVAILQDEWQDEWKKHVYGPIPKDAFIASLYKQALNAQWALSLVHTRARAYFSVHSISVWLNAYPNWCPGSVATYQMCLPGHRCANWEFPCSSCRPPKCSALEGQKKYRIGNYRWQMLAKLENMKKWGKY